MNHYNRGLFILIGVVISVLMVTLLSLILEQGTFAAELLLDMSSDDQSFPYPFTIQNLMWVILGMSLGELYYRLTCVNKELITLNLDILDEKSNTMITLNDVEAYSAKVRHFQSQYSSHLTSMINECLLYFRANKSIGNTQLLLNNLVDLQLHRLDLNYTFLKYSAWLLPTTGFIGTVIGIANALNLLDNTESISANMDQVINTLAMAFNTTILALCFSSLLVFLIQSIQKTEEEAINKSAEYCLKNLINRLYIPEN